MRLYHYFLSNPVAITNSGKELQPGAVISAFATFFNQPILTLRCFSLSDHGQLQWRARGVEALPDLQVLGSDTVEAVNISYSSNPERRYVVVTHHPFSSRGTGYYVCRSEESSYKVEVYTTLDNPILGTGLTHAVHSATWSSNNHLVSLCCFFIGYQNNGLGFTFQLRFIPLPESLPVAVLVSGVTDRLAPCFPTHFQQSFKVRVLISSLVR